MNSCGMFFFCLFVFLKAAHKLWSVLLSLSRPAIVFMSTLCRWKTHIRNSSAGLRWSWRGGGWWFPKFLFHTHEHTPWVRWAHGRGGGGRGRERSSFPPSLLYFQARNSLCGSSDRGAEQDRTEPELLSLHWATSLIKSQWGHGSAEPLSDSLRGAPAHWAHPGAGAAGQHLLRHRPADGGQGPVRQRHLPRHPPLQGGQPAESHVGLLHDLQPHHPVHADPAFDAPGLAERPRLEEDPDRGVPERVPGVQARPAPGGHLWPTAGGDVRSGGSVRAVRRLLRLLVRRNDAGVARLHGDGAVQGQCDRVVVVRSGLLVSVKNSDID